MKTLVFVHGYSVTNIDTYGGMPRRLQLEAEDRNLNLRIEHLWLGRYISFHDEVQVADIARAFETAIREQLPANERFVCITHSTGGPVVREWWHRYYNNATPPISHLIMLAPANFGSALARLGKGVISRLASWAQGVEPGQNVLNWLELGSIQAWRLNREWIFGSGELVGSKGIFPFVLTGQSLDRAFYDHLNKYTDEIGSDGVVRAASANLNTRYIRLEQNLIKNEDGMYSPSNELHVDLDVQVPKVKVPYRIIRGKAHSGDKIGIMRSVKPEAGHERGQETVDAIFRCLAVNELDAYEALYQEFEQETVAVQAEELVETVDRSLFRDKYFIRDRYVQIIFRLVDSEGHPIRDYDLILTAGEENSPNQFPSGFMRNDPQINKLNPENRTYFLNYDLLNGVDAVNDPEGAMLRSKIEPTNKIGLRIVPRPDTGFVRYAPAEIKASREMFDLVIKPNSTTLIEIVMQRLVSSETMRLEPYTGEPIYKSFKDTKAGQGHPVK